MEKINILIDVDEDFLPKAKYVFRTIFKILGWKISCFTTLRSEPIHLYYGKKTESVFPIKIYHNPEAAAFFRKKEAYPENKLNFFLFRNEYIPFLFSQKGEIFQIQSEQSYLRKDIIASAFYFLSCWQEFILPGAENFVEENAIQIKYGFEELPPVDRYCEILNELLKISFNEYEDKSIWKNDKSFAAVFSADIKKSLLSESAETRKIFSSVKSKKINLSYFVQVGINISETEQNEELKLLLLELFRDRNINLLGSEETAFHLDLLKLELSFFDSLQTKGFRTEFYRNQVLFSLLEKLKIKFDSSIAFKNRSGFRAGISFPFYPFNLKENRAFSVLEIPVATTQDALSVQCEGNAKKILKKLKTMQKAAQKHRSLLNVVFNAEAIIKNKKQNKIFSRFIDSVRRQNGWLCSAEEITEYWEKR